jgi:hypothetical protein
MQGDSKLLSGFPFLGHGNPDNNLESVGTMHRPNAKKIVMQFYSVGKQSAQ